MNEHGGRWFRSHTAEAASFGAHLSYETETTRRRQSCVRVLLVCQSLEDCRSRNSRMSLVCRGIEGENPVAIEREGGSRGGDDASLSAPQKVRSGKGPGDPPLASDVIKLATGDKLWFEQRFQSLTL